MWDSVDVQMFQSELREGELILDSKLIEYTSMIS